MADYLIPVRDSGVQGLDPQGLCPGCATWRTIWPHDHPFGAGRMGIHFKESGPLCPSSHSLITLDAALSRDEELNPQERAVHDAIRRYFNGCRGPLVNELCQHPACHRAVDKGLHWTLEGWRRQAENTLF